ncbi:MAG: COX15/CtaA family protein [Chloroflexi bacterium]|nr:COX15/CtaA family protein [Chloroflexota bacterium]
MLKTLTSIAAREKGPPVFVSQLRSVLDVRYLALLTTLATYALIVLGGTVRATDSGLACLDWPRCHGELIPPLQTKVLIEYAHRLTAVAVALLILGTAASAWLWRRGDRRVTAGVTLALVLVVVQALVGGATVNMELPATIVALHLAIALVLLAVLIVTTIAAFVPADSKAGVSNGPVAAAGRRSQAFLLAAGVAAAATFALILTGSYVASSGAGLVYPDWPLFNGKLVAAGGRLGDLHYAHRLMAAGVGVFLLATAVQAWRRPRSGRILISVGAALVLYVAQVFVGASNIWFDLAISVRIAHLALASALWASLVVAISWAYLERRRT